RQPPWSRRAEANCCSETPPLARATGAAPALGLGCFVAVLSHQRPGHRGAGCGLPTRRWLTEQVVRFRRNTNALSFGHHFILRIDRMRLRPAVMNFKRETNCEISMACEQTRPFG